jgi:hypothetical protein
MRRNLTFVGDCHLLFRPASGTDTIGTLRFTVRVERQSQVVGRRGAS